MYDSSTKDNALKKTVFQLGDKVKIVNPEVFVRCGYPITLEMETEEIVQKYGKEIWDLIEKVGIEKDVYSSIINAPIFNKIAKQLAYSTLKQKKFGGYNREIHTRREEYLMGEIFEVTGKKVVKTGTYCPGYGGPDYFGEYDYTPAYLQNEKAHIILTVSQSSETKKGYVYVGNVIEIDSKNVELIKD